MKNRLTILLGKTLKRAARLRGGGSAMPGLVVEKLDPGFLARTLGNLPLGTALVTGTNGKTTTTKIVAALLRDQGLRVFTNRSGSNFTRGVASEVLGAIRPDGDLPYDIAVLELDEAHATHFIRQVRPRHTLVLNVMRDQLDRFGEIDHTARLLRQVAEATTGGVVLNRDDPRVAALAEGLGTGQDSGAGKPSGGPRVTYFGAAGPLQKLFVNDDELHAASGAAIDAAAQPGAAAASGRSASKHARPATANDVQLESFDGRRVTYRMDGKTVSAGLLLSDVYNFLNAAGALALCRAVLRDSAAQTGAAGRKSAAQADDVPGNATAQLLQALARVEPAFGRGETFTVDGQPLELTLVKNPGGFRLALRSFNPAGTAVMIAINDNYADGRDMSWLWDVDFGSLRDGGVALAAGIRAYDMALRLQYDDVAAAAVEPGLDKALRQFIRQNPGRPKRIFCTYTAMLALRRELKQYTAVEHAL